MAHLVTPCALRYLFVQAAARPEFTVGFPPRGATTRGTSPRRYSSSHRVPRTKGTVIHCRLHRVIPRARLSLLVTSTSMTALAGESDDR
jgi:hypothetical protein